MNIEELRNLCLSLKATDESFPFDDQTLVFKVMNKMFILCSLNSNPLRFNFKAIPEDGITYRESYPAVIPGYHSDKKHWNTVSLDGSVPKDVLEKFILDSYNLVVAGLPKYKQKELREDDTQNS
jgi:predicted DNA-binding protein (MmcQ/YjbR family)